MVKARREQLPARTCANPSCRTESGERTTFIPERSSQVFHDTPCRKSYWRAAVHYAPHACPLCTVVHDPEESAILDALDMLIAFDTWDSAEGTRGDVKAFIARRREILATKPAAPA